MGNAYLDKQEKLRKTFLGIGEEVGMQKMWDYVQLALRDPEVMGRDILGRQRIEKIYKKLSELADTYHLAFTEETEADYMQETLDKNLKEIWGDDLQTFFERYPYFKQIGYDKPHKNWR